MGLCFSCICLNASSLLDDDGTYVFRDLIHGIDDVMDSAADATGKVAAVKAEASSSRATIEFSVRIVILASSRDTVDTKMGVSGNMGRF
jgi:hypothetical protein